MDAIRNNRPYNEVQRGAEASLITAMGRMAAHTGQVITRDQMLQRKKEEMLALFTSNLVEQMEKNGKIKKNQAQIDAMSKRAGGVGGF